MRPILGRMEYCKMLEHSNASITDILEKVGRAGSQTVCSGISEAAAAYLTVYIHQTLQIPVLALLPTPEKAQTFVADAAFFADKAAAAVNYFPPYNLLPFKNLAYHNETAANRVRVLHTMLDSPTPPLMVAPLNALQPKVIPKKALIDYAELLMVEEETNRDQLIEKLAAGGYERTHLVEEPGDFCVRGSIMDIFSPLYDDPLRIEFYGDLIESIRFFSALSQRSQEHLQEAVILPAREALVEPERRDIVINEIRARASAQELPVTKTRDLIQRLKTDGAFAGMESLLPLLFGELDTPLAYFPDNGVVIEVAPDEIEAAEQKFNEQVDKNYQSALADGRLCVPPDSLWTPLEELREQARQGGRRVLSLALFAGRRPYPNGDGQDAPLHLAVEDNTTISWNLKNTSQKGRLLLPLVHWIQEKKETGQTVLMVCRGKTQGRRLGDLLSGYGVRPRICQGFLEAFNSDGSGPVMCLGQISKGFAWPRERLALITDKEIFGVQYHRRRKSRPETVRQKLLTLEDLKSGDLVVHEDHGIGRYEDLVKMRVDGVTNDFLLLRYKDDDKLYLPVDRMGMIHKYIGVEGIVPDLDKMGAKSWERVKARVKATAEKIAGELLDLYARRRVAEGNAFTEISDELRDFEAGFVYQETRDQEKAIQEVLADMQRPMPMDRLVCGDVGYGKTEVALRAAFLTVSNGKQVAVMVPTTVLAEQHHATFKERFAGYPINTACLSRFRSAAQQREIIARLKEGKIDIVVGTHRLLQKDVAFKDLGLLVIDEEQRFGVKHKERLKKMRQNVDVLALTATPIPRTLHLSLTGVRDISVISTPPELRQPIITYVCEFDEAIVTDALRRELARKGQIFFVHNRVQNIQSVADRLQQLVPEVRLGIAHGQLSEDALEEVMVAFIDQKIDLLVCTTIIESGLDIPSANTIMINRADKFGLAQMYQLRGRVGRADTQAYAYLFIPPDTQLSRDAQKRMKVLMDHTDLGSGFQIAMSDLKIRGGGTILGASQSGHIAAVGYDLFLQLMENAIAELKGEAVVEKLSPEINVRMSAYVPESYMAGVDQRLSAYRRLSGMQEVQEIIEFKKEMADRYGPLPEEVTNLLVKMMLKLLCVRAGVHRFDLLDTQLHLYFSEKHLKHPEALLRMVAARPNQYAFTPQHVLQVKIDPHPLPQQIKQAKKLLNEIIENVNN